MRIRSSSLMHKYDLCPLVGFSSGWIACVSSFFVAANSRKTQSKCLFKCHRKMPVKNWNPNSLLEYIKNENVINFMAFFSFPFKILKFQRQNARLPWVSHKMNENKYFQAENFIYNKNHVVLTLTNGKKSCSSIFLTRIEWNLLLCTVFQRWIPMI